MNDQFLRDYYKYPNLKVIQNIENNLRLSREKYRINRIFLSFKPAVIIGIALILISALLLVSPVVRAQVYEWIQQIGGVFLLETNEYPGKSSPVQTIPYEQYSIDEVGKVLPFEIRLPHWIPEDFELVPMVKVSRFSQVAITAYIDWETPSDTIFSLIIQHRLDGENGGLIVGEGSVKEFLVNGEPAALILGGWNADSQKWDYNLDLITLNWRHDDHIYTLQGLNEDVSLDELLRIAESIQ